MISSFFKTTKNKRFNFSPRYYNADKEAFDERVKRIKAEMEGESTLSAGVGPSLRSRWEANKKTTSFSQKSNIRLVLIVALLAALCYFILYT